MPTRKAEASWKGGLKRGTGSLRTESKAVKAKYSFSSRFAEGKGTNPEELIAAAHAGCFSQALAMMLGEEDLVPDLITTLAEVTVEKKDGGFLISKIVLKTEAEVPNIEEDKFIEIAKKAKEGCPVSVALRNVPNIELEAKLL